MQGGNNIYGKGIRPKKNNMSVSRSRPNFTLSPDPGTFFWPHEKKYLVSPTLPPNSGGYRHHTIEIE